MRTVHFVYSIPRGNLFDRIRDRLSRYGVLPYRYRNGKMTWNHPVRSPHSITFHLLQALRTRYRVKLYSMYEKGKITLKPGDFMIGSPVPVGHFSSAPRSGGDDPTSIVSRTIRENSEGKTFLLMPYAREEGYSSWVRTLAGEADGLMLVCSDLWTRDTKDTPLGDLTLYDWMRIPMCIDPKDYPLVKETFNPPGTRKILYIGHDAWYKNVPELERIATALPQYSFGHLGSGSVSGWKNIASFATLTPEFMKEIAREYDLFVTVSTADPQATTILEQMCFGMPIACTPETGYEYPSIVRLSTTDTAHNVKQLELLQHMPEEQLRALVRQNRETAIHSHHWNQFTDPILAYLISHE